jgi:serine/threonine-protein kinase HipA
MSESLEVWLDADFLPERIQVGMLAHDRGTVRFTYEPAWLKHPLSFALDPDAPPTRIAESQACRAV